jgi:MFS family permease
MAFASTTTLIQFFVFLIGFGGGVLNGATNALAADISEGERSAKLSVLGVFFGIGALGMPSTLAALSAHFSLTAIVAGIGVFVLLPVIYFLVIVFPPAKQQKDKFSVGKMLGLLKDPIFVFAGIALAIQSGMEGMSNDWITRYFRQVILVEENIPEWKTLLGLMAVTGAMVLARIALGILLKHFNSYLVLFGSIAMSAVGALLLMSGRSYGVALAASMLIGAGLAASFPVILSYIGDLYPERSGTAFSTIFFLALVGNMTINKTFGAVAQKFGIHQYTNAMLVCLGLFAFLLFLVIKRLKKHTPGIINKQNEQSRETMVG